MQRIRKVRTHSRQKVRMEDVLNQQLERYKWTERVTLSALFVAVC